MKTETRDQFIKLWRHYFNNAELPVTFYYSTTLNEAEPAERPPEHRCILCDFNRVRSGKSLAFNRDNIGCNGGKRYAGYKSEPGKDFEYFLSCGIPGKMKGERYKKDPETVRKFMENFPKTSTTEKWLIVKRWDQLNADDTPEIAIFFAKPDVLSGLFTLANYDRTDMNGVTAPFGSGCSTTLLYPYLEKEKNSPNGIIGMFDTSARPCVQNDIITFSIPVRRLAELTEEMSRSFLITETWGQIQKRIK